MKQALGVFLFAIMVFCAASQARAYTVVDTGTPVNTSGGFSLGNIPAADDGSYDAFSQFLAARFTLDQDASLTSVLGWLNNGKDYSGASGVISLDIATISIYGDTTNSNSQFIPDSTNKKYSMDFIAMNHEASWVGLSGLNWDLAKGSYWVAFEAKPDSTFAGGMPTPSPNPLSNEAFQPNSGDWVPYPLSLGVKITADNAVVTPEPLSAGLFLVGGGVMALARRRMKHNS